MKNSNPSQEKQILKFLQSGRSITPLAALKRWGCFRLGARIFQLRKSHEIENVWEERDGKRYARYRIVKNSVSK